MDLKKEPPAQLRQPPTKVFTPIPGAAMSPILMKMLEQDGFPVSPYSGPKSPAKKKSSTEPTSHVRSDSESNWPERKDFNIKLIRKIRVSGFMEPTEYASPENPEYKGELDVFSNGKKVGAISLSTEIGGSQVGIDLIDIEKKRKGFARTLLSPAGILPEIVRGFRLKRDVDVTMYATDLNHVGLSCGKVALPHIFPNAQFTDAKTLKKLITDALAKEFWKEHGETIYKLRKTESAHVGNEQAVDLELKEFQAWVIQELGISWNRFLKNMESPEGRKKFAKEAINTSGLVALNYPNLLRYEMESFDLVAKIQMN